MALTVLYCSQASGTDLSPLKDIPLTSLFCDFKPERDTDPLRSIKTLETINGKPAAEFWKEHAAAAELDGEWLFVEGSVSDKKIEPGIGVGKDRRLVIQGDRYRLYFADKVIEGNLSCDPATSPKSMDFIPEMGGAESDRGKVQRAIYEADGELLKICVGGHDGQRPMEFNNQPQDWSIQVYRRIGTE